MRQTLYGKGILVFSYRFSLLAILLVVLASSMTVATHRPPEQIAQDVEAMMQSNLTTQSAADRFLLTEFLKLRHSIYFWDVYPKEHLHQSVIDAQSQIFGLYASVELLQKQVNDLSSKIGAQQEQIQLLQSRIDKDAVKWDSVLQTIGKSFKSVGETLLSISSDPAPLSPPPSISPQPPKKEPVVVVRPPHPSIPGDRVRPVTYWADKKYEKGQDPPKAFDEDIETYFSKSYFGAAYPVTLYGRFDQSQVVSAIEVVSRPIPDILVGGRVVVLGSEDDATYVPVGSFDLPVINGGGSARITIPGGRAYTYWAVQFVSKSGGDPNQLQFSELRFFS